MLRLVMVSLAAGLAAGEGVAPAPNPDVVARPAMEEEHVETPMGATDFEEERVETSAAGANSSRAFAVSASSLSEAAANAAGLACKSFKLTGRVQMVHYRWWVLGIAQRYGIKGWVANGGDKTYDGSHAPCPTCGVVLGHAEGPSGKMDQFLSTVCRGGPKGSHVESCRTYGTSCRDCPSFHREHKFCHSWSVEGCKSGCWRCKRGC